MVGRGEIQLPDFQRSWIWDEGRIKKLVESVINGFPMGSVMFLQCGKPVNMAHRLLETVDANDRNIKEPDFLVLDGQQRLTSLFQVFQSTQAVKTCSEYSKIRKISRYYYIDINKALSNSNYLEAIISIPEDRMLKKNIGRDTVLDLRTKEAAYQHMFFPLNLVFDDSEIYKWLCFLESEKDNLSKFIRFLKCVIEPIKQYKVPIIKLPKDTSKELICQIFENVNTGGIPLSVFDLVTATFASQGGNLREEWEKITYEFKNSNYDSLLSGIDPMTFLTSLTLLSNFRKSCRNGSDGENSVVVSCKRKDILDLSFKDFLECKDVLIKGFQLSAKFLMHQGIYTYRTIPYPSQLIPLAAIYSVAIESRLNLDHANNHSILNQWFWCGVFGELYSVASDSRYVHDLVDVIKQINGENIIPDTVSQSSFHKLRLLYIQRRNSAVYKGLMALIIQDQPLDFLCGNKMDTASYLNESIDIHHIFPRNFCKKMGYPNYVYDSIINMTPIYADTNRSIGSKAPSKYLQIANCPKELLIKAVTSHRIDYSLLASDNFWGFIKDRMEKLCDRIELATKKKVLGRESGEILISFPEEGEIRNEYSNTEYSEIIPPAQNSNNNANGKNVFKIITPNGEVWCEKFAYNTLIRFIEEVGIQKVEALNLKPKSGIPLITPCPINGERYKETRSGLFVLTSLSNVNKIDVVKKVCTAFDLNYSVYIVTMKM